MQSNEVILEKEAHIIIYKIVDFFGEISLRYLLALTHDLLSILYEPIKVDSVIPSKKSIYNYVRELTLYKKTITDMKSRNYIKRNDKRIKEYIPILIQKEYKGKYFINPKVTVKIQNKKLESIIDNYLKSRVITPQLRESIIINHTKKLKDEIITPWLSLLSRLSNVSESYSEYLNSMRYDLKLHVLYEDLSNHLPQKSYLDSKLPIKQKDDRNPLKIEEDLEKKIDKYLKEYKNLFNQLVPIAKDFVKDVPKEIMFEIYIEGIIKSAINFQLKKIGNLENHIIIDRAIINRASKKVKNNNSQDAVSLVRGFNISYGFGGRPKFLLGFSLTDNRKVILEIFNNFFYSTKVIRKIEEYRKKIEWLEKEIDKLKNELRYILKELEAYEVLEGSCKYILSIKTPTNSDNTNLNGYNR